MLSLVDVRRFAREGIGLDLREDDGVTDALPLPLTEPGRAAGVDVPLPPALPSPADPGGAGAKTSGRLIRNILVVIQPNHVASYVARSCSSRFLSNALRYRSYDSLNDRSTREEKISSPRGFNEGGIGAMGTDELRFDMR